MSTILWVAVAISSVVLLAIVVLWYFVATKSRSKKMAREQAQLDKKTGVDGAYVATPSASKTEDEEGRSRKYRKYWTIVFVLAWLGVVGWGFFISAEAPALADVGKWIWSRWLWVIIVWVLFAAVVALNAEALGKAAKVLQWVLATAVFLLFVGIPVGGHIAIAVGVTTLKRTSCLDVSARETRRCVINTSWSEPLKPANEPEMTGKRLCYTPDPPAVEFERVVTSGGTFWRFRSTKGDVLLSYGALDTCSKSTSS